MARGVYAQRIRHGTASWVACAMQSLRDEIAVDWDLNDKISIKSTRREVTFSLASGWLYRMWLSTFTRMPSILEYAHVDRQLLAIY